MSTRQHIPRRTSVPSGTDYKGNNPRRIAKEQLIPQIARRTENAIAVASKPIAFFRRIKSGRRCSCFMMAAAAEGNCQICFATSYVGGYEKYGCMTEIIDITRPGLQTLGLRPPFEKMFRPMVLSLTGTSLKGVIETEITFAANAKLVDYLKAEYTLRDRRKSAVQVLIKPWGTSDFVLLNEKVLKLALHGRNAVIRVILTRTNANVASPLFSHLVLRYRLLQDISLSADIPKRKESVILRDYGIQDSYDYLNFVLPNKIKTLCNEDFFVLLDEGTRWKVKEVTPNRPLGQLTSYQAVGRLIGHSEPYMKIPL